MDELVGGNRPAARGRLGFELNQKLAEASAEAITRDACHVTTCLDELGNLTVQVNTRAEYQPGSYVGATIEQDDVPKDLLEELRNVLNLVLEEAHPFLKEEVDREVKLAANHTAPPQVRQVIAVAQKQEIVDLQERIAMRAQQAEDSRREQEETARRLKQEEADRQKGL